MRKSAPAVMKCATGLLNSTTPAARGLHSFTFQLNVSAFCGIGGALRVCLGVVSRVFRRCRGNWGVLGIYRVYFVSDTAQVELKSGRV